jgi:hypothetical protein
MDNPWDAYLNNLDEKGEARTRTDASYCDLARGLRELRVEHKKRFGLPYSLENVATEINISPEALYRFENWDYGDSDFLPLSQIKVYASLFGMSMSFTLR